MAFFKLCTMIITTMIACSREELLHSAQKVSLHPHLQEILDDMAYSPWTAWSNCLKEACTQFRMKRCRGVFVHQMGLCRAHVRIQKRYCCDADKLQATQAPTMSIVLEKDKNDTETNFTLNISISTTGNTSLIKRSNYFPDEKCGIREQPNLMPNLRILGGQTTQPNSWPWMVSIFDTRSDVYFCGGTLIHPRFILTAAHCVLHFETGSRRFTNMRRPNLGMLIGDHVRGQMDRTQKMLRVRRILYHRNFNPHLVTYDVALVEIEESVPRSPGVDYACLPAAEQMLKENTMCVVIGWGMTGKDSQPPRALQEARVYLTSNARCQRHYTRRRIFQHIHLCAGARGRDTCNGDSGGPLLCPVSDGSGGNRWILYGITSFGPLEGCGHTNGVYQRVTAVTGWIQRVIKRYSASHN